ncbi:MAG: ABC transporter ATP-binding protein [Firmicutes bacterium]|jgi:ABC-2 type transport system ATP-binding protein|nr:ABC transporter ATP-binding protein [Bacillota bacterium]MDH7496022.1 ABC transporter ATP-binding protein [Bacillota bacterium]
MGVRTQATATTRGGATVDENARGTKAAAMRAAALAKGSGDPDAPALALSGVGKRYPKFELKEVSFVLPRGYIMGFIGPNGAGKSTTIKIIMNMVRKSAGTVAVLGLDHVTCETEVKRHIGYLGEEPHFYQEVTPAWLGAFVAKYYPTWDGRLYASTLERFGIERSKPVKSLSKGMKVKLGLALALSHRPELLILDEPTSGLDPVVRHDVLSELMSVIQDERRSVFFSTHITQDVEKVADYVTFINEGKVVISDVKDDVLARWKRVSFPLPLLPEDGGARDPAHLERAVAEARAKVERAVRGTLGRAFAAHKIEDLTFTGITSAFSEDVEREIRSLAGTKPRVLPVSLDDILVAIVRGNEAC